MTPDEGNSMRIGQGILDLFAGQPQADCDNATISALAVAIGASYQMSGGRKEQALVHVEALFMDVVASIERDFGTYQRGDH